VLQEMVVGTLFGLLVIKIYKMPKFELLDGAFKKLREKYTKNNRFF
jgi:hypothetical protein